MLFTTKKRSTILALICCFALIFSACGSSSPAPQPPQDAPADGEPGEVDEFAEYGYYEWKYALNTSLTHSRTIVYENFAKNVYNATNGHVNITLYGAGELPYAVTEYVSLAASGLVEITDSSSANVTGEWKSIAIPTYPFICTNWADFKKLRDAILPIVKEELKNDWDCRVLFFGADPMQVMCGAGKPILSIADFKGRNVRGQNAYVQQFLLLAGASPVTVSVGEIAEAINHNMIDTFTTGAATISSFKLYEYANWFLDGALLCTASYATISNKVFDELPKALQDVVLEQADIAEAEFWKVSEEQHKAAVQIFVDAGLDIFQMDEAFMREGYELVNESWKEWASSANDYSVRALEATLKALYGN